MSRNPVYENFSAQRSGIQATLKHPTEDSRADIYSNTADIYSNMADIYSNIDELYSNLESPSFN